MTATLRFRDVFRKYVPAWLSDRPSSGRTVGNRVLWSMIAPLDAALDQMVQGLAARMPGLGTPTALGLLGRSRMIFRGRDESDESYALRLLSWLDRWRIAGTAEAVARVIHEYLPSHPRVRVVSRSGKWVTIEDGEISRTDAPWDWDSASHPENAGHWSEIWVIVYPDEWAHSGELGDPGEVFGRPGGLGHAVPRSDYDAIRGLLATWKSAHTRIVAVIWSDDGAKFDPEDEDTLPEGTWGAWSTRGNGHRVASGRDPDCRYWEPS